LIGFMKLIMLMNPKVLWYGNANSRRNDVIQPKGMMNKSPARRLKIPVVILSPYW